jgi:glycosyltransferase involved in cell wall biosynthesis
MSASSVDDAVAATRVLDVLVPHYQDVAGLRASLESVRCQSWRGELRVIIVDDGSDAATFAEVEQLAAAQPFEVTVRRFRVNMGRPFARNALLDEVDAPFIAWLDAGEIWYPDKLRLQFEHLRRLEFDGIDIDRVWVTCHYDWSQDGRVRRVEQQWSEDQLSDLLIGDRLRAYLWTVVGRTNAFRAAGRFDEALPRLQDMDYFVRFLGAGGVLTAPDTDAPLCRYDKSDAGRNHADIAACADLIMRKHRSSFAKYGRGFIARANWKYAKLSARYARNNNSYGAAFRYLAVAAASNPRYAVYRACRSIVGR